MPTITTPSRTRRPTAVSPRSRARTASPLKLPPAPKHREKKPLRLRHIHNRRADFVANLSEGVASQLHTFVLDRLSLEAATKRTAIRHIIRVDIAKMSLGNACDYNAKHLVQDLLDRPHVFL